MLFYNRFKFKILCLNWLLSIVPIFGFSLPLSYRGIYIVPQYPLVHILIQSQSIQLFYKREEILSTNVENIIELSSKSSLLQFELSKIELSKTELDGKNQSHLIKPKIEHYIEWLNKSTIHIKSEFVDTSNVELNIQYQYQILWKKDKGNIRLIRDLSFYSSKFTI